MNSKGHLIIPLVAGIIIAEIGGVLEELVDNHFDVCAVNTEWYDWGRKIRITVSMNDLTTIHNDIKEIVESCVEQYYGDTVKEYSLFLEL